MCGFVGFVDDTKKTDKDKIIKNMADRIIHRGPDSSGYYVDKYCALGFRRLSIIDLNTGSQPMYNEDKRVVVLFNGEIYNYPELKKDLIDKGHVFKTKADTEVLVHGYEEYKEKMFSKLRGMFSFIIYDQKEKKIIGVRDYFGIKPMYYYKNDKEFMFASEIKAFLSHPNFIKELNIEAIKPYLCFQVSVLDETFFKNTYRLNPGEYFIYQNNKLIIKKYFELNTERINSKYEVIKKELSKILDDSVKVHQISDVEVGSFLSGGVDSSYIVSSALPDKTFTVGFDNKGFDETSYAKELSKILNIKIYDKHINKKEFFDNLSKIQYFMDEPDANVSAVPLFFLSEMASKYVKVVLSGEGADEMFAGYNEYNESFLRKTYHKIPLKIRKSFASLVKKMPDFKGKEGIINNSKSLEDSYIGPGIIMNDAEANDLLNEPYKTDIKTKDILKPYYDKVKGKNRIEKKQFIDMNFWLPKDILLKADKMTMASSLELRVPFLDKEVYNLASKTKTDYYIKDGKTKYLFRDIASSRIPQEWAKRRKLAFPVPVAKYFRDADTFKEIKKALNGPIGSKFFNQEKVNTILEEHLKGEKNSRRIYVLYAFVLWYENYFIKE